MSSLQTCCTSTSTSIEAASGGLREWFLLIKPGIVFGNMVSIAGAFFLASRGAPDYLLLLATLLGVSLVVASACVLNNIYDRDIDARMERTRLRPLVSGAIAPRAAGLFALVLGALGFALLAGLTNRHALGVAGAGYLIYLVCYTLYLKRSSVHATLIGSLSGAAPPLAGYCAVSGGFDAGAWLVLLIFSLWQMPHAYAIAIYRLRDYANAAIPVLPVVRGVDVARRHMLAYILAFAAAAALLVPCGQAHWPYLAVVCLMGGYWFYSACNEAGNDAGRWARKQFIYSIVMVTGLSLAMSVDHLASNLLL